MLSIIEKFKNRKILLKNSSKIGPLFGRRSCKIGTSLTRWLAKLNNWYAFGTLARLFVRWCVKIKSWHAFDTWSRRPGMHAWQECHAILQTHLRLNNKKSTTSEYLCFPIPFAYNRRSLFQTSGNHGMIFRSEYSKTSKWH